MAAQRTRLYEILNGRVRLNRDAWKAASSSERLEYWRARDAQFARESRQRRELELTSELRG